MHSTPTKTPTRVVYFRADAELVAALEKAHARLRERLPGIDVTLSDAIRELVWGGLRAPGAAL